MQANEAGMSSIPVWTRRLKVILIGSCLALSAAGAEDLRGLDEFVAQAMAASGTPGVAVAVVRGEKVTVARGYGVREVGRSDAVDKDTLFAIGSNSKYFTAIALGLLVHEGRLSWDAPLTRYVPPLRFSDPYLFTQLTLRDALAHRAGLQRGDLAWKVNPGLTRAQVLAQIEQLPLEIPFRSGFLYNNYMFVAAGEAIAPVAGVGWDEFVKTRLFRPAGMSRSNTSVVDLKHNSNVATPHAVTDGKAVPIAYYNLDHVGPAGSINSSAADMAQWCKVQLRDGKLGGRQVIPDAVIREVRKPHNFRPPPEDSPVGGVHSTYALGLSRANYGPEQTVYSHGGCIDGMLSYFGFVPGADACAVVLTNGAPNYGLQNAIATWIFNRLLDLEPKNPLAQFANNLRKEKAKEAKVRQQHSASHDPGVASSLSLQAYAGSYVHDLYGELIVSTSGGGLQFTWGRLGPGRLQHHRGDSFDLAHSEVTLNSAPFVLSFAMDARGGVESALLQRMTEEPLVVRFARKQEAPK